MLGFFAVKTLAGAAFPRVAYWLRWPTRLRGRALAAYVAASTLQRYAVMTWVRRWLRRHVEMTERLREELGREPTDQELEDWLARPQNAPGGAGGGA